MVERSSVMAQLGEHEQVYRITQLAKGRLSAPPPPLEIIFFSPQRIKFAMFFYFIPIPFKKPKLWVIFFPFRSLGTGTKDFASSSFFIYLYLGTF